MQIPRTLRDYRETIGARLKAAKERVGYEVRDPLSQRVGSVEKVSVDGDGEPEYVRVKIRQADARHTESRARRKQPRSTTQRLATGLVSNPKRKGRT